MWILIVICNAMKCHFVKLKGQFLNAVILGLNAADKAHRESSILGLESLRLMDSTGFNARKLAYSYCNPLSFLVLAWKRIRLLLDIEQILAITANRQSVMKKLIRQETVKQ